MAESPEGQGQNRPGSSSYEKANLFQRLTYTWVSPLTRRTAGRPAGEEVLEESDVAPLVPGAYDARQLYSSFEKEYEKRKTLFWTLVFLHRPLLGIHALLILGVTGMRQVGQAAGWLPLCLVHVEENHGLEAAACGGGEDVVEGVLTEQFAGGGASA